jgi:predicted DNA-binding transcriptional regulator YafY
MKPRKNLPKTAVPRIYFIDQEIASGSYPNAPDMAKKYETSLSSINRDISYMRDMLGAPIKYDFFKKGFFYTKKTFRLSAAYATADDLLALGMVKKLMEYYKNTPIHNAALNLLESISAPLRDEKNTEWFKDRIVIPKTVYAPVHTSTWEGIVGGLRKNRVITFQYENTDSENLNNQAITLDKHRVHPYQLFFQQSAWYLYAYDEDRKGMRMFAFSKISNVVLEKETFTIPRDFDYHRLEGTTYFSYYTGSKTFRFVIKISGDTRWIKERIWADDQKIEETSDGIKLSFTSSINQVEKVLEWILFQGANARPLAPKPLVTRWEDTVRKMYSIISP